MLAPRCPAYPLKLQPAEPLGKHDGSMAGLGGHPPRTAENTMKVTHSTSLASQGVQSRNDAVAQSYGASSAGQADMPSAQVALSPAARQLAALQDGSGDIDQARVEEIRAAIAQGKLSINPGRIADSLIASAQELLK